MSHSFAHTTDEAYTPEVRMVSLRMTQTINFKDKGCFNVAKITCDEGLLQVQFENGRSMKTTSLRTKWFIFQCGAFIYEYDSLFYRQFKREYRKPML